MGSFYVLEITVKPGGARRNDYYIYNNLDEIKKTLEENFTFYEEIFLLTCYGEEINLMIYNENKIADTINLLPFIKVRIEGYPEMSFNNEGKLIGFDVKKDERENEEENTLSYKLTFDLIEKFEVIIDWDSIKIPKLEGSIIEKGDSVKIVIPSWSEMSELDYGYNNLA